MPKQGARAEVNTFAQGIVTDASILNFPANASVDELNFEICPDGTRDRRLGLDYESPSTLRQINPIGDWWKGTTSYKWEGVNGDSNLDFFVFQLGATLSFYQARSNGGSISADYKGKLSLTNYLDRYSPTEMYSMTSINGKLVVASGSPTVAIISWDGSTFSTEYVSLKVRDIWGKQETVDANYETDPTHRSPTWIWQHLYNLHNQGWGVPRLHSTYGSTTAPAESYAVTNLKYPSNSEVVWTGMQFTPAASGAEPYESYYPKIGQQLIGSASHAPKGYFIIDLLNRGEDRSTKYQANTAKFGITTSMETTNGIPLYVDKTYGGASCVEEFAGRVFFGGFHGTLSGGDKRSPHLNNHVAFSQLVKGSSDIPKCYQEGDPTSRENSDIVDTDGGIVRISGARDIIALRSNGTNLIILARNGIWSISGGSDYGFSATNYKVSKVSSFGCDSPGTILSEGGKIYYWSSDGIYVVAPDQFGSLQVTNISKGRIQGLFDAIPSDSRKSAMGAYDRVTNKIRWIYNLVRPLHINSQVYEIVLDLASGAYTRNKYSDIDSNVSIIGIFSDVQLASTTTLDTRPSASTSIRYVIASYDASFNLSIGFAHLKSFEFKDLKSHNGVGTDYDSYIITGAQTAGDSAVEKQVPYLIMHFLRTETSVVSEAIQNQSSCLVRSMWNWATSTTSNKWGAQFQAYRYRRPVFVTDADEPYDNGFEVITTKNKIRGRGKAFSFHLQAESGKDCRILGWNITVNGNPR